MIDKHTKCMEEENYINDATCGTKYQEIKQVLTGRYDLCLLWNTNGAFVSKSSKGEIWPIQIQILNIPVQNRRNFHFLAGLYYSNDKKPNMNTFLKPFAVALKDLYNNGFDWINKSTNMINIAVSPVATLDCPARAAVHSVMQFNGAYGCSFCEHHGITCETGQGHTRIYPRLHPEPSLRTKENMIIQPAQKFTYGQTITHRLDMAISNRLAIICIAIANALAMVGQRTLSQSLPTLW